MDKEFRQGCGVRALRYCEGCYRTDQEWKPCLEFPVLLQSGTELRFVLCRSCLVEMLKLIPATELPITV